MPDKHSRSKAPQPAAPADGPAMSFNEALKRVWRAPPAPNVKPKPAGKPR